MKHTPGPWRILQGNSNLIIHNNHGLEIAKIKKTNSDACYYNADLICAAPKMIESLLEVKIFIDSLQEFGVQFNGYDNMLLAIKSAGVSTIEKELAENNADCINSEYIPYKGNSAPTITTNGPGIDIGGGMSITPNGIGLNL